MGTPTLEQCYLGPEKGSLKDLREQKRKNHDVIQPNRSYVNTCVNNTMHTGQVQLENAIIALQTVANIAAAFHAGLKQDSLSKDGLRENIDLFTKTVTELTTQGIFPTSDPSCFYIYQQMEAELAFLETQIQLKDTEAKIEKAEETPKIKRSSRLVGASFNQFCAYMYELKCKIMGEYRKRNGGLPTPKLPGVLQPPFFFISTEIYLKQIAKDDAKKAAIMSNQAISCSKDNTTDKKIEIKIDCMDQATAAMKDLHC